MRVQGELSVRIIMRAELRLGEASFQEEALIQAYLPLPRVTEKQIGIILRETSAGGQLGVGSTTQRVVLWEERLRENHPFIVNCHFLYIERHRGVYGLAKGMQAEGRKVGQSENGTTEYGVEERVENEYDSTLLPPSAYLRGLTAELATGVTEPLVRAKCPYGFITKRVRYSFMPSYFYLGGMAECCAVGRVGGRST